MDPAHGASPFETALTSYFGSSSGANSFQEAASGQLICRINVTRGSDTDTPGRTSPVTDIDCVGGIAAADGALLFYLDPENVMGMMATRLHETNIRATANGSYSHQSPDAHPVVSSTGIRLQRPICWGRGANISSLQVFTRELESKPVGVSAITVVGALPVARFVEELNGSGNHPPKHAGTLHQIGRALRPTIAAVMGIQNS